MKRTLLEISLFLIFSFQLSAVFGQAPQKLSYQAVIRNSANSIVTNKPISMQVSVLKGSGTGVPVYVEKQYPFTNQNGLVSIEIGNGTPVTGTFGSINWNNGPFFIKTETDPNNGTSYTITGVTELVSVPFSLNSKTAGTADAANIVLSPAQPNITSVGTLTDLTVTAPIAGSVTGTSNNVTGIVMPQHGGTGVNAASSNFVFAGPDGATGAPSFRAMVPNDVPSGSGHYIANGTSPQALSNFNVTGSGTIGTSLTVNNPTNTTGIIAGDNTSRTSPNLQLLGYSTDGIDGGGGLEISDGGTVALRMMRTNDNNFKVTTNFGSNFNVMPEGNFGINTTTPAYKLDVNGTMRSIGNAVMGADLEVIGTTLTQDINVAGALAVNGNASFTTIPTTLTAPKGDYSTNVATTEFAQRAVNDAALTPGYGVDIAGGVISTQKADYAFLGINNTNAGGAQDLYLNWPYTDYINGVTYTSGNTFTLRTGRMYEVTATMYIYNAGAESYFYDFKNVTDNIEYSNYGAFFGEGTPYVDYTTQTIRFMYKPAYDTDFQFQRASTNVINPNIIGNIIIKEIK